MLYRPEIPPNTGNIIRLCANTGAQLHLVGPLGFELDEARVRRAGLDYRELATVTEYDGLDACRAALVDRRWFAFSTRGGVALQDRRFEPGDVLLFGPETAGLPERVVASVGPDRLTRIPMMPGNRSLNLSNAVAVAVFEAWRQNNFKGSE